MSQPGFSLMLGVAVSFLGALALTPLVRFAARRWGMVARPKADRWHRQPTALMGGVAIFVSVMTAELLVAPMDRQVVALLGASSFLFLVGLLDDLVTLKPYQKLAAQVLAALALIGGGLTLSWIGHPAPNAATTLLWLVGITNAVNLLDNMDGLAAGTTVIVRIDRNGRPRAGARSRRAGPDPGLKTPVGKPWDDHRGVVIEVGGRAGRTRRRERASREGRPGSCGRTAAVVAEGSGVPARAWVSDWAGGADRPLAVASASWCASGRGQASIMHLVRSPGRTTAGTMTIMVDRARETDPRWKGKLDPAGLGRCPIGKHGERRGTANQAGVSGPSGSKLTPWASGRVSEELMVLVARRM